MKRSKHTLSHYRMHTARMGQLFPIACVPVLPGDTIKHRTSALIRLSPLVTPVMHPVRVRIHHWFVPNRIVWPESENGGWENFITGGKDGNNTAQVPGIVLSSPTKVGLHNYLGVPPGTATESVEFNALPLRAANLIFNEFYRDQDIVPERDNDDVTRMYCAWEKDYFTTARPWTQKGAGITLPIGEGYVGVESGTIDDVLSIFQNDDPTDGSRISTDGQSAQLGGALAPYPNTGSLKVNLEAIDINEFRTAFSLQRYQEARARYGSRFTEYLRYLGITPSDARLQRPEYLGGGVSRINFSEVLQTTPASEPDTPGVGDLYGHGIAGVSSNAYVKFFEEHGYIISMMSVRPKATYLNGVHREWLKKDKEDYFQRELANLGQQEVYRMELNRNVDDLTDVFGYQDRYEEYRHHPSYVGQDFRDVLNSYHLGRDLPQDVALNRDFIDCKPSDRIFQVSQDTFDPLWIMCNHHMVARRIVPKRAYPRIL